MSRIGAGAGSIFVHDTAIAASSMSGYQYYEFQAIDRPLGAADRQALRDLSSLANWGSRRLMIRLPARLLDRDRLDSFIKEVDCAELSIRGRHVILDIVRDEVASEDWDDGSGWLAALTPLRAAILAGDLRLFYLLWLMAVEAEAIGADEPEPLPGIGRMNGSLEAFAGFFGIDPDLVEAAAGPTPVESEISTETARQVIMAMPDNEKTALLVRLFEDAPHGASELRAEVRRRLEPEADLVRPAARTVGELRARAEAIRRAREQAAADKAAERLRQLAEKARKDREARLTALARRGESVWHEIESEIERRDAPGYDKAAGLLADLKAIAEDQGTIEDFRRRIGAIRERHARKGNFIERLSAIG